MSFNKEIEPLLKEDHNRFVLFPIKYQDIYDLWKLSLASFWTAEEIKFSKDINDWNNKLNDDERFFIKNILAFFAFSDGIVNENLAINFSNEIQVMEARNLYYTQLMIESIHGEVYSKYIDTLVRDSAEKDALFNSMTTNPIVSKKASWALKWVTNGTFPERLLAFGVIEGVFFSGSFCAIFWLKQRNLMPALVQGNHFISRDESLHCETCVLLYSKLVQKLPQETVHSIFMEAYVIEKEFITKSLPVSLIGMNSSSMIKYIEFICDYWLVKLNYAKLFNTPNPFPWMDYISLETKTSFFEKDETNYSAANIGNTTQEMSFSLEEDF